MTETMTRALAQQQRQIQAEDATLQGMCVVLQFIVIHRVLSSIILCVKTDCGCLFVALAAQDRRFDDMREQREQKIREVRCSFRFAACCLFVLSFLVLFVCDALLWWQEVERIKDSEQVRSAQQDMLVRVALFC